MKILVTGGGGYLGGRIAIYFKQLGHSVGIITSKVELSVKKEYFGIEVNNISILDNDDLLRVTVGVDVIIHCAGPNSEFASFNSFKAAEFSGIGTYSLLNAAISNGVSRFYYFSTIHVYSSPLVGVIDEFSALSNYHPYAITHRIAEDFIILAIRSKLIEGGVIRLSNSFGPPVLWELDSWKLAINNMCYDAVFKGLIQLKSNINTERNFISIKKIEKFLEYELTVNTVFKDPSCIYNLGYSRNYSLIEIANLIKQKCEILLKKDISILYQESDTADIQPFKFESKLIEMSEFDFVEDIEQDISEFIVFIGHHYNLDDNNKVI